MRRGGGNGDKSQAAFDVAGNVGRLRQDPQSSDAAFCDLLQVVIFFSRDAEQDKAYGLLRLLHVHAIEDKVVECRKCRIRNVDLRFADPVGKCGVPEGEEGVGGAEGVEHFRERVAALLGRMPVCQDRVLVKAEIDTFLLFFRPSVHVERFFKKGHQPEPVGLAGNVLQMQFAAERDGILFPGVIGALRNADGVHGYDCRRLGHGDRRTRVQGVFPGLQADFVAGVEVCLEHVRADLALPVILRHPFRVCDEFSVDITIHLCVYQCEGFVQPTDAQPDIVIVLFGTQHRVHHQNLRLLVEVDRKRIGTGAGQQGQDD